MPDNASRRGAVDLGMPLMILAFAVIGGFMYWLSGQAAIENAIQITEDTAVVADDSGAPTVTLGELEADPAPYLGTDVRVSGFEVASMLGTQGFWLGTPSGNPFLVSMSADVMAEGMAIAVGDLVDVVGNVNAMNDSTLTAWSELETVGPNDRIVAEFATYFLEAATITVTGTAAPSGN